MEEIQKIDRLSNKDYREIKRLSASDCKSLLDDPFAFKMGIKKEKTTSLTLGSLTHTLILEPEKFNRDFLVVEQELNLRKIEDKIKLQELKERAEAERKELVFREEVEKAGEIAESVLSCDIGKLFKNGLAENSFLGEVLGRPCKCRPDFYLKEKEVVIDLKTTKQGGASPKEFSKSVANFKYHLQARFYLELLQAKSFVFVVVETEAPYRVGCYQLDTATLDKGLDLIQKSFNIYDNLDKYERIYKDDDFNVLQTISIPNYAFFD